MEPLNRTYRDSVFRALFRDPKNALSLYNALNHSAYTDVSQLTITTIESAIYMSYKNDCSFLYQDYMSLWEHQSTLNPNMPLRGMIYFTQLFETYVRKTGQNMLSNRRVMLPTPQYFVFYNGEREQPEIQLIKLSDSYLQEVKNGIYEWTCTVLNINAGHNQELLNACRPLLEYSQFVQNMIVAKGNVEQNPNAVEEAIDYCIEHNILKEYLEKEKGSLMTWILAEYNAEEVNRINREYERELGMEEGLKEGIEKGLERGLEQGLEQGLERGLEQGIVQGLEKARIQIATSIRSLVENSAMSLAELLSAFQMSKEEYSSLLSKS